MSTCRAPIQFSAHRDIRSVCINLLTYSAIESAHISQASSIRGRTSDTIPLWKRGSMVLHQEMACNGRCCSATNATFTTMNGAASPRLAAASCTR